MKNWTPAAVAVILLAILPGAARPQEAAAAPASALELPDGRALPFSGPSWETEEQRGPVLMGVVDDMVLDASLVLDRLERLNGCQPDGAGGNPVPSRRRGRDRP